MNLTHINNFIRVASIFGFILSLYAYIVETSKEKDPTYQAMCDINEHMSCSKVFTSKYGRGFGLLHHIVGNDSILNQPNCLGGIIFYCLVVVLSFWDSTTASKVLVGLAAVSNVCSVYLAFILYFVLHDFCIVCVSTYIVNAINLIMAYLKLKCLENTSERLKTN